MLLNLSTTTEIANTLREYNITATLQRVEIARALFAKRDHLSAEQVLEKVNEGRNIVSKATVYNTLRLFSKRGLIKEVIVDPTKVFYEPKTTDHHHFYNVDTGRLIDFEADFPAINQFPLAPDGTDVVGVDVTIRVRNAHA